MSQALPAAVFERFYPSLGPASGTRRVDSGASNTHFIVEASGARYFLKQIAHPDALYEGSGIRRLRSVCRAIRELRAAGLPVEELIATDEGAFLAEHEGSVFRLYRFIDGRHYDHSAADLRLAATALGRLHAEGREALESRTATELSAFKTPFALSSTAQRLNELGAVLYRRTGIDAEQDLEAALTLVEGLDEVPAAPVLAHLDFHPGNMLFAGPDAFVLDLDNMMLEAPLKCVALAILRFAFWNGEPQKKRLLTASNLWAEAYEPASGITLDETLLRWMAYIELEKILRIVLRVETTGRYEFFLDNVASRHLPNLRLVLATAAR